MLEAIVTDAKIAVDHTKDVAEKTANDVVKAIEDLKNVEVTAFDFDSEVTGYFNLSNSNASAMVDFKYLNYNLNQFDRKNLTKGQYALPSFDELQLTAICLGTDLKSSKMPYYAKRDEIIKNGIAATPKAVIYFSSERFVNFCGGEVLGPKIIAAYVKGDYSIMDEIKELLIFELRQIESWAYFNGVSLDQAFYEKVIDALINGKEMNLGVKVNMKNVTVEYAYKPEVIGTSFLPKVARDEVQRLYGYLIPNAGAAVKINHTGFYIESSIDGVYQKVRDRAQHIKANTGSLKSNRDRIHDAVQKVMQSINEIAIKELLKGIGKSDIYDEQLASDIASYAKIFDINSEEVVVKLGSEGYVVDLTGTDVARYISEKMKNIAIGNKREAKLTRCELDLTTMTLHFRAVLTNCQSWGRFGDIIR